MERRALSDRDVWMLVAAGHLNLRGAHLPGAALDGAAAGAEEGAAAGAGHPRGGGCGPPAARLSCPRDPTCGRSRPPNAASPPMTRETATPLQSRAFVERRRARVCDAVGRPLLPAGPAAEPLSPDRLEFFRREAEELYWNELEWEELTDEEAIQGGHLTELVFPGFLAFVEGLLVEKVPADAQAPARPHPDAVEAILGFLGERHAELAGQLEAGADSQRVVWARAMTARLTDLVLYRLYGLSPEEQERAEQAE
jgi:hypothetical protein